MEEMLSQAPEHLLEVPLVMHLWSKLLVPLLWLERVSQQNQRPLRGRLDK